MIARHATMRGKTPGYEIPTIRTSGNSRSHMLHQGYLRTSRFQSQWERPAGEPPIWLGTIILAAGILTICVTVLLIAALHHSPRQSSTTPLVAAPATSAVEAGGVATEIAR